MGVLGLTFKEDCPDLRNTKVIDIITELKFLEPVHGKAHIKNLKSIKNNGKDRFVKEETIWYITK